MFELCCSPISGGNFISQIAILTKLLEVRNRSQQIEKLHMDLYLGASGGSLANIISTFFEGSKESIERILYTMDSKMFVQNWWKGKVNFIDSKLISVFKDSIYQSGTGAVENFKKLVSEDYFTQKDIPENWFLTYNNDKNTPVIHSTLTSESTLFNELEEINNSEIKFLNTDLEKIVNTVMASASIPGLKKSVNLEDENHVDGGIANPSPYYYFSESIYQKCNTLQLKPPYHYYYLQPHSLKIENKDTGIWLGDVLIGIQKMIVYNILKDREYMFENWLRIIKKGKKDLFHLVFSKVTKKEMMELLEENQNYDYFIIMYTEENSIDITTFKKTDLENSFNKCYDSVFIEIFINKNG